MTTTDLKPGDVVRQPAHGYGIVYVDGTGETLVMHRNAKGHVGIDDLDEEWERAEIVKPGHVQVRVDDLDPQTLSEWSQGRPRDLEETALLRIGRAMIASQVEHGDPSPHWRAESTPTADEQDANVEPLPHTVMVELRCPHGCGAPVRAKLVSWPSRSTPASPPSPTSRPDSVPSSRSGASGSCAPTKTGTPGSTITARGPVTVLSEGLAS